jgi:hypothetical protein
MDATRGPVSGWVGSVTQSRSIWLCVDLSHDLGEYVDRRVALAEQRQAAADLLVAGQQCTTRLAARDMFLKRPHLRVGARPEGGIDVPASLGRV